MGMETKSVGGSEGAGEFGGDVLGQLGALLGPSFGFFDDLLSPGGGRLGGAREDLVNRSFDRSSNRLAAQFSLGGNAFGTPAATAATRLEAERGPGLIESIGQLQLSGLDRILPGIFGLAGKDIPQRQTVQQQGGFGQALGLLAPGLGAAFGPGGLLAGEFFKNIFKGKSVGSANPNIGIGQREFTAGTTGSFFDDQLSNLPNLGFLG